MDKGLTRREVVKRGVVGVGAVAAASLGGSLVLNILRPLPDIPNPLEHYPSRDWEQVYRDQYRYDSTFTFVCAPNDTHNCRLRACVRNGIIVRFEQSYDVQDYRDLYGNTPPATWNPRGCPKGYTLGRRLYGPYRIKTPRIRHTCGGGRTDGRGYRGTRPPRTWPAACCTSWRHTKAPAGRRSSSPRATIRTWLRRRTAPAPWS